MHSQRTIEARCRCRFESYYQRHTFDVSTNPLHNSKIKSRKEVKAKTKARIKFKFDFAINMRINNKKQKGNVQSIYKRISHYTWIGMVVAALLSIAASLATFIVPYTETTAGLCSALHMINTTLMGLLIILFGILIFCAD